MKKLITLCFFAMALLLGTQNGFAQDEKYEPLKEDAKVLAKELKKIMGLDDIQTKVVARALFAKSKGSLDISESGEEVRNPAQNQEKIEANYKTSLLKVLTDEQLVQMSTYLANRIKM